MTAVRIAVGLIGLIMLTGCASAHYHTDAEWATDLSDLPQACKDEPEPMKTVDAVKERIAEIPTRLVLPSECDRQLLATAATKLITKSRTQILGFVNRQ